MTMAKWQILAGNVLIGETSSFNYSDANRDDICQERWALMSKARELYPEKPDPGYVYRLVKADDTSFTSQDIDVRGTNE